MKQHAAGGRIRPGRTATAAAPTEQRRRARSVDLSAAIDAAHRYRLIAEAAYYRAEARGFGADGILDDWLMAEHEVDQLLMSATAPRRARRIRQGT